MFTAAVVMLACLGGGIWYVAGRRALPTTAVGASRDPVSVLVADFDNRTGDAVFDGVVEQSLVLGVEGASFVSVFPRRDALRSAEAIKPGSRLDEQSARLVAIREGLNLVLSGTVEALSSGYIITVRAVEPSSTGPPVATQSVQAADKAAVLGAVGRLAGIIRVALGDPGIDASRASVSNNFVTAANLEAAHEYAQAQDLQAAGKVDLSIVHYREAIRLDPNLGRAYSGLATQLANSGRPVEADQMYQQALARLDRMTEREKYRTRGVYYLSSHNAEKALQEFTSLIRAYPADDVGRANLALAHFLQRDMARALEEGRASSKQLPNNVIRRNNVALFEMYAGQFESALADADEVLKLNPTYLKAHVARALSQLALGRSADAVQSWKTLTALSPAGASIAAVGQADLALFEGRAKDAIALIEPMIRIDLAATNASAAAIKCVLLAQAHAAISETAAALRDADQALALAPTDAVRFSVGQLYARLGRAPQAAKVGDTLVRQLDVDAQAYGRLLLADVALAQRIGRAALDAARDAQKIADTWPGRIVLARAYIELGAFAEASSELDIVQRRRGEATAMFLDDVPTYRAFAQVADLTRRVQQGLRSRAQ